MKPHHYNLILIAVVTTALMLTQFLATSLWWQHQAVIHHSAFFEASSWGNVSFHWNDDSFAQTPFQDETWEKVQASIFQAKLKSLNIN